MSSSGRKHSNWRLRTFACVFAAVLVLVGVAGFIGVIGFPAVSGESSWMAGQTGFDSSVSQPAAAKYAGPTDGLVSGSEDEVAAPASTSETASGSPKSGSQQKTALLPEHIALDKTSDIAPVEAEHEADSVLIGVDEGMSADMINDLLKRADFVVTKDVSDQDLSLGFVELSLVPGTDVARAAYTLEETGVVDGAQPNYIYHLLDDGAGKAAGAASPLGALTATNLQLQSTTINDPRANSQWALQAVHAYEAWDIAKTDRAVTVAVVDNGCIVDHEDLKANIVATYNAVKGGTDVSHVTSSYHGTHVAGIVGAVTNNSLGVAGVSYNARLLPIQVFEAGADGKEGASTSSISTAYAYIKNHASEYNIKVVNMSVGGELSSYDRTDKLLIAAIESAYENGIVSVCAAGNKSESASAYKCFPVDYSENIVGVINLEKNENAPDGTGVSVASTSNYNLPEQSTKDISAPGSNILSTYGSSVTSYGHLSGTSMATPLVAGIMALEFAADPDLSAAEAVDALYGGAADLMGDGVWDENTGYGMVDAYKTVQALGVGMSGADAVAVGETTQLKPTKHSASPWSWSSSDAAIATVDSSGNVTGEAVGTVTISATYGSLAVSKELVVHESAFSNSAYMVSKGKSTALSLSSTLPSGSWSFSSSDPSVATVSVDLSGNIAVTGKSVGAATITAKNSAYGVTVATTATVYAPSIVDADSLDTSLSVLEGHSLVVRLENQPEGDWVWRSSAEGLATVTVDENDSTKATITGVKSGRATITAALVGNDGFTVNTPVEVGAIELSGEMTEIEFSSDNFTYSPAGPCEPDFVVKFNGATLASEYYTYSYANNENAGKAMLTIVGRNGYVGKVAKGFIVNPRPVDGVVFSKIADQSYSGSGLYPSLTVTETVTSTYSPPAYDWLPIPLPQMSSTTTYTLAADSDYTLSYTNNVNVGTATITLTGMGNYTGTRSVSFVIKPTSISKVSVENIANQTYAGIAITPTPSITYKGKTLKAAVDYTVAYSNNMKAGWACVTLTGRGNYIGSKYVMFKISKADNDITLGKTRVKKTLKATLLKKKAKYVALPKTTAAFGDAEWNIYKKDEKKVLTLKNGKVRVKKGAKKGTYAIKLQAKVAGNPNYASAASKVVTVKVKVS